MAWKGKVGLKTKNEKTQSTDFLILKKNKPSNEDLTKLKFLLHSHMINTVLGSEM
jgi:hypothetical protein